MGFLRNKDREESKKKVLAEIKEKAEKEPEKEEPKERFMVVAELPVQKVREAKSEDGEIIHLITIEEALTEIIEFINKE